MLSVISIVIDFVDRWFVNCSIVNLFASLYRRMSTCGCLFKGMCSHVLSCYASDQGVTTEKKSHTPGKCYRDLLPVPEALASCVGNTQLICYRDFFPASTGGRGCVCISRHTPYIFFFFCLKNRTSLHSRHSQTKSK